jgi:hypothetical protein
VRDALRPQAADPVPFDASASDVIDMETGETSAPDNLLSDYLDGLATADDSESAALVLDHARTALDAPRFEVLATAYRARFSPQENEE